MTRKFTNSRKLAGAALTTLLLLGGCGGGEDDVSSVPIKNTEKYTILSWNDLGMHCLNPTYDTAVILPPYNTVMAQVIVRGKPPRILTPADGITVTYEILNNTTSQKTDTLGRNFTQFWQFSKQLFETIFTGNTYPLSTDVGLTGNKLSGTMKYVSSDKHFEATGIPVTPLNDSSIWNPYQVVKITVTDANGYTFSTQNTVPTSDEINCGKCHPIGAPSQNFTAVFEDIVKRHKGYDLTTLPKPILCASCHGSPALNTATKPPAKSYLSQAIHGFHSDTSKVTVTPACSDCHPGAKTKCNRSKAHSDITLVPPAAGSTESCTNAKCHGTLANVAATIRNDGRIPWLVEPNCANTNCHSVSIPEVYTGNATDGSSLYRNRKGHGGLYCAGCHGSPHAMYPVDPNSLDTTGDYQPKQYQSKAKSLGSCGVCHTDSRGKGADEFAGEHNGKTASACNICHTGFNAPGDILKWPHQFKWQNSNN